MKELKDWNKQALKMREEGYKSRAIAERLLGRSTAKSTVNDFFLKYDSGLYSLIEKERKSLNGVSLSECISDKDLETPKKNYETEILVRQALSNIKNKPTILVIADTQCKSEESLEYMKWIGKYIASKKPDILVHIGDHFDLPSLSSYDKGKSSSEGRRLYKDIEAGNIGFEYLNQYIDSVPNYTPRKVFCLGNHEHRLDRYVDDNPELVGTLGTDKLPFAKYGWEVHPFLKPVEINGIFFVHYLANPMNGRPYGGNAMSILKTVGRSFVVGHKQTLDSAIRPTIDGKLQLGIVNGACYPFDEGYKGFQGNNHFRGITILTEVEDGFGCPSFVSLDHMRDLYYG